MQLVLIALLVLVLDQASKYAVKSAMELNQSIPLIPRVFHLTYIQNPGAAFGLLANRTSFFIWITFLVVALILVFYRQIPGDRRWTRLALAMMLGGAVGNLIDRLRAGSVVDFLDFRFWPVFNLADSAIVVGMGLLAWQLLRSGQAE